MDQVALVEDQIAGGRQVVERLTRQGVRVTAAFWAKSAEDDQWFLYLVSPVVDEEGILKAYRRLHPVFYGEEPPLAVDPLEVKLISPNDPIAEAVADLHRRRPEMKGTHLGYEAWRLGNLIVSGGYIYPPVQGTR